VIGRIVGGFRNRNTRRGVAILWDLGTFWPRWFHPLAPPTYSDVAVTRLTRLMGDRLSKGEPLLLAPHSQGTIIAAASVLETTETTARLALLTYGCPWSRLYARAFPALFTQDALDQLCTKLAGEGDRSVRWRNLFRGTDPIGGAIGKPPPGVPPRWSTAFEDLDVGPMPDPCKRKHSDYPREPQYVEAARHLRREIV
jgi:hypothetical protein